MQDFEICIEPGHLMKGAAPSCTGLLVDAPSCTLSHLLTLRLTASLEAEQKGAAPVGSLLPQATLLPGLAYAHVIVIQNQPL